MAVVAGNVDHYTGVRLGCVVVRIHASRGQERTQKMLVSERLL